MSFITRYFDGLIEPLFKTDDMGRRLFFPAGVLSKGRVILDEDRVMDLKRKVRMAYMVFFLVFIPLLAGLTPWLGSSAWVPAILIGLAAGLAMNAYLFSLARGLPKTSERMNVGEAYRAQAVKLGRGWLLTLAISTGVLAVGSLMLAFLDPKTGMLAGLSGAVFFVALAAVFVYQLRSLPPRTQA